MCDEMNAANAFADLPDCVEWRIFINNLTDNWNCVVDRFSSDNV